MRPRRGPICIDEFTLNASRGRWTRAVRGPTGPRPLALARTRAFRYSTGGGCAAAAGVHASVCVRVGKEHRCAAGGPIEQWPCHAWAPPPAAERGTWACGSFRAYCSCLSGFGGHRPLMGLHVIVGTGGRSCRRLFWQLISLKLQA